MDAQEPGTSQIDDAKDLGSATPTNSRGFQARPFNREQAQENTRGQIAIALIVLLALTVTGSFFFLILRPEHEKELHEWLHIIFNPLVALVGTAIGYYFGSQSSTKRKPIEN